MEDEGEEEYYSNRRSHRVHQHNNMHDHVASQREPKVDLPPFHGKEDVEAYLDWEIKVEQLFKCHEIREERKVSLDTLSFRHALHW